MNIYLDIDGVIVTKDLQPARHVNKFLSHLTGKYPVFWLTTHCKGDASYAINHLTKILDDETLKLAKRIKPTSWNYSKTDAINFNEPFRWFDDYIFPFEKEVLLKNNALESWIEVDLSQNPNHLHDLLSQL